MSASRTTLSGQKWKQDLMLRSLIEDVVFSQQELRKDSGLFGQLLYELQTELKDIGGHQHQAIDRLCNLRKNLRDRFIFRQKSRQIWGYFTYQAAILSLIYWGIFVYVVTEMGFFNHQNIILLSVSLYILGLISLILIAKGKKWRI